MSTAPEDSPGAPRRVPERLDVRPLNRFRSFKVKLGILVAASVAVAALLTQVSIRAGIAPLLALPLVVIAALVFTQLLARGMTSPLREMTGADFTPDPNKFHALTSKDALVFAHGALKALAANLMKIANDIRWEASGPRCGMGELHIPENEPGSSIMPGKVNPTQCEAVTMVAVQVMGNDAAIGFAASQGNFELNVFMPVIAYNFLQSARLLADAMASFNDRCLSGLQANRPRMEELLEKSLMLVTCLTPHIGYEKAAACAKAAHKEGITLREAVLRTGLLTEADYERIVDPAKMV